MAEHDEIFVLSNDGDEQGYELIQQLAIGMCLGSSGVTAIGLQMDTKDARHTHKRTFIMDGQTAYGLMDALIDLVLVDDCAKRVKEIIDGD